MKKPRKQYPKDEFRVGQKFDRRGYDVSHLGYYQCKEVRPHHVVIQFKRNDGRIRWTETYTKTVVREFLDPRPRTMLFEDL